MEEPLDPLTSGIIGCAIAVHRFLGPGLLESIYHRGLEVEFSATGLHFVRQRAIEVKYRGVAPGEFHPDFIVEDKVVLEIKSASTIASLTRKYRLTYD